jgi:hypothetical protein
MTMSDQATPAVAADPGADLLAAIGGGEEVETHEAESAETEQPAADAAPQQEEEPKPEGEAPRYKVTVKTATGEDEEREVPADELVKGYMLQADYTRKTQELSTQRQAIEVNYRQALQEQQSKAVEQLDKLQELVLAQAAPELNGVDWVSLSVSDPARFVQLQARQQQMQNTWAALEQQKTQARQAQEQALSQAVSAVFKASDEHLSREIPGLDAAKTAKLLGDVQKSLGWAGDDLKHAARALAQAGMHPGTLGQVLVLAHKAIQFDELQKSKPAALAKVAAAPPKVVKPAAPQPRSAQDNRAATERLQRHGRIDDLAALIPR